MAHKAIIRMHILEQDYLQLGFSWTTTIYRLYISVNSIVHRYISVNRIVCGVTFDRRYMPGKTFLAGQTCARGLRSLARGAAARGMPARAEITEASGHCKLSMGAGAGTGASARANERHRAEPKKSPRRNVS
jgi:hypothetical protein